MLATVEVKTRVAPERIAEAETIAPHWNDKLIICNIGTDDAEAVMDKEHLTQVMIQMATCNLHWGVYIVGQAGFSNTTGRIIYTVFLYASSEILNEFVSSTITMFDDVLVPFYNCTTLEELKENLPETLTSSERKLIRSRWPFFSLARSYVVPNLFF